MPSSTGTHTEYTAVTGDLDRNRCREGCLSPTLACGYWTTRSMSSSHHRQSPLPTPFDAHSYGSVVYGFKPYRHCSPVNRIECLFIDFEQQQVGR